MERMTNRAIERNGVLYFKCKKCGEEKPLNSAHFHRNTTAMMGYNSKCIECVREEMKTIYKPKERYITKAELEEENKVIKEEKEMLIRQNTLLQESNKKLKSDLHFERTMLDNVRAEYKSLENVIKELKEKNETLKEELISRIRQPQNVPYGKGVAELMEEDTLQELRDLGEI